MDICHLDRNHTQNHGDQDMIEFIHAFATLIGMLTILLICARVLEIIARSGYWAAHDTFHIIKLYWEADQDKRDEISYFPFRAVRKFFRTFFTTAKNETFGIRRYR